jgi:hypothetical protein
MHAQEHSTVVDITVDTRLDEETVPSTVSRRSNRTRIVYKHHTTHTLKNANVGGDDNIAALPFVAGISLLLGGAGRGGHYFAAPG